MPTSTFRILLLSAPQGDQRTLFVGSLAEVLQCSAVLAGAWLEWLEGEARLPYPIWTGLSGLEAVEFFEVLTAAGGRTEVCLNPEPFETRRDYVLDRSPAF